MYGELQNMLSCNQKAFLRCHRLPQTACQPSFQWQLAFSPKRTCNSPNQPRADQGRSSEAANIYSLYLFVIHTIYLNLILYIVIYSFFPKYKNNTANSRGIFIIPQAVLRPHNLRSWHRIRKAHQVGRKSSRRCLGSLVLGAGVVG